MAEFMSPTFWGGLMTIIGINIVLSGDNAVVIALAARSLPPRQQKLAIMWGSGAAVVMRILLTIVAVELLRLPYLKLIGGVLLLWIAVQLMMPEDDEGGHGENVVSIWGAMKTILVADLVMSLDNVIAVAAAAKGSLSLLIIGLAISIPLVVFGSTLLLKLMERYPIIITIGAALLGWVAGEMFVTDPLVKDWVDANAGILHWIGPALGAVAVVVVGKWLAGRVLAKRVAERGPAAVAPASPRAPIVAGAPMFSRVVLPFDASPSAARAVAYGIELWRRNPALELHLVNVQGEVSGDVSRFTSSGSVDSYHREQGEAALAPARKLLDDAGVKYVVHMEVGPPAQEIARVAARVHGDLIVMGTRGLGSVAGSLLGSVAQGVAQVSAVPVLLVK